MAQRLIGAASRQRRAAALLAAAWCGFLVCLLLPAVVFDSGEPVRGWEVGRYAVAQIPDFHEDWNAVRFALSGLTNVILAALPVLVFTTTRVVLIPAAIALGLGLGAAVTFLWAGETLGSGYYLWFAAIAAATAGVVMRIIRRDRMAG